MDARRRIDSLERTGDLVARLVHGLPEEVASWKAGERDWSIVEILGHLADEEVEDFRYRLRSTLEDPRAAWPPIDPEGRVRERAYAGRDLEDVRRRFVRERADSIAWLRGLGEVDWSLAHEHPTLGTLRAGDLLASWAAHDLLHLRQLTARLFQRGAQDARPFDCAYAGPW